MDAVVDEHFRAEMAVDIDAVLATYADEVEFDVVGNPDGVLHDKSGIRVFYNMLFGELSNARMRSVRRWYGAEHVVDESVVEALAIGRPFGFEGRDRPVAFRLLHIFDFADGRISRESAWLDLAAFMQQLA